jgi:hypothetical protein
MRQGWQRGWGDGNRIWATIGAAAVIIRLLQRFGGPGKATIIAEDLRPGEALVIRHLKPGE